MSARSGARRRRWLPGQSIVEFALVAPVFFMLVFGTIEFGRLIWTAHELENGTREAMRYAAVHGSTSGAPVTDLEDKLLNKTVGITSAVVVNCSGCGGDRGQTLTVTSSYEFSFLVSGLLGVGPITLEAESQGIIHH
jgi:Flp pilus assembly protein TadG